MDIRWGLLTVITVVLYARVLCVPPRHHFTEGEDATIIFSQALDKPLEVYTWSLQYADKERPFYIQFGVHDADGSFYPDMLKTPQQRDRMSVSLEMSEGVLSVNFLITRVLNYDAGTYLLTVAEKGSTQAHIVREAFLYVLSSCGDTYMPRNPDDMFLGQSNFCALAYTAPQVITWRYVRFSAVEEVGTFYCYYLYPSSGEFITGHVFNINSSYDKIVMVDVDKSFCCCMHSPYRERCEYYELGNTGDLMLVSENKKELNYPPFRKPSITTGTDTTDQSWSSQSTTVVQPETEKLPLVALSIAVILFACFSIVLFILCILFTCKGYESTCNSSESTDETNETQKEQMQQMIDFKGNSV